jgi:hypothetical protein
MDNSVIWDSANNVPLYYFTGDAVPFSFNIKLNDMIIKYQTTDVSGHIDQHVENSIQIIAIGNGTLPTAQMGYQARLRFVG